MNVLLPFFVREDQDEEFDLLEEVRRIAGHDGWEPLLSEALAILGNREQANYWYPAICVIYWSLSSQPALPCSLEECIARLYVCLEQWPIHDERDADNLVWSTVTSLKGVSYLSEWDPYKDPSVCQHMARYRQEA
jgi:hypothetical protein